MDRSILEVYCGGAALTDRLYPDASATGVELFAEAGVAHVKTVSVWPCGRCAAYGYREDSAPQIRTRDRRSG